MKLTVVIVNYNVKYYLEQCLHSLEVALRDVDAEVYVVDNHSSDGSIEYLKPRFAALAHPRIHFIQSNHNIGFSRANNIAIRQSQSDYVLLLNPDTFVAENTIAEALAFMDEHPKAGALGVSMLQSDGHIARESRRGLPTPMTSFYKLSGLCERFPMHHRIGRYYMSYLPWDEAAKIEVISGAFCLLRREALDKVGLLDEAFFMYGEDIDLSFRVLKGGYENWFLPVRILHYKGESTHKSSLRYVHVFYDAMLIFFRKYYGHMSFLFSLPIKIAIYFKAFVELIKMQIIKMRKSLGFFSKRPIVIPVYTFLAPKEHLEACRSFARRRGLDARFVEATAQSHPHGHHEESLGLDPIPMSRYGYMVYDTSAYTYGQILEIFASKPIDNILIATYYPEQDMVITSEDILL